MSSHATPGPAAKRRRIELANATLRRPFRSPMIKNRSSSGDMSTPTATRLRTKPMEPGEAAGGGGDNDGAAGVTGGGGEKEEEDEEEDNDDNEAETSFETSFSSVTTAPAARKVSKGSLHYGGPTGLRSTSTRWNVKPLPSSDLNSEKDGVPEFRKAATISGISRKRSSLGSGSLTTVTSITPKKRPSLGQSYTTKVRTVVGEGGLDNDEDEILAKLQKFHIATKLHLVAMQKELDLIRQAKRIEMASRKKAFAEEGSKERLRRQVSDATVIDAELKELVQKWKLASRQAAEDLFELIKGRVADMGGAKAWRETRRRQVEGFHSAWDEEDQRKGKKRKGNADEREIADSDAASDDDGFDDDGGLLSQGAGNNDGEESAEDDCEGSGFTMLMMLQSLNIEPDVLGYDPNEDKWLD